MKKIIILLSILIIGTGFTLAFDQNFYLNTPATLLDGQNNDLELKPGVNFLLNDEYKVISVYGGGSYPRLKNVFWNNNGLYFIRSCAGGYGCDDINTSIETQGYIQSVLTCDIEDTYCTTSPTTISINQFISNNNYSSPDYMILNDNQWNNTTLNMCLVYDDLDIQVCIPFDQLGLTDSLGFTYNPLPSQLGQSEDQISSYFNSSPFSQARTTTPDTEEVCITVQQFFNIYGSTNNYNTGLCYTQERYLTQTGRVQITPKFITELYPTYQEFRQDVNTRNNYCRPPATQQTCQQAFNGKEENRTLINKLQEGTDPAIIYDMCNIYQTRSGNMQKNFCDMTEEEGKIIGENTITTEKYAERIANNPTTITTPISGTVYDELTDETNRDILEAIPRVYTKITGIFKGRQGTNGIIPYYITGLLLVIVLFKLFKK